MGIRPLTGSLLFINEEPAGFSPGFLLLAHCAPFPLTLGPVPSLPTPAGLGHVLQFEISYQTSCGEGSGLPCSPCPSRPLAPRCDLLALPLQQGWCSHSEGSSVREGARAAVFGCVLSSTQNNPGDLISDELLGVEQERAHQKSDGSAFWIPVLERRSCC